MARILCISSSVVRGSVGLSAVQPALWSLGHEVWPVATVTLSNHPGHGRPHGVVTPPDTIKGMILALEPHGWLDEVDAVLTGYLPSPEHVDVVADIVALLKSKREMLYLCDPVMGDQGKGLYIAQAAAEKLIQRLVPLADIITPNRFELGHIIGADLPSAADVAWATSGLMPKTTIVTSAERRGDKLASFIVSPQGSGVEEVRFLDHVPNGTGDLLAALYLGHALQGADEGQAFKLAIAGVDRVVRSSEGRDELDLTRLFAGSKASHL